jgi:hypothetical protein
VVVAAAAEEEEEEMETALTTMPTRTSMASRS